MTNSKPLPEPLVESIQSIIDLAQTTHDKRTVDHIWAGIMEEFGEACKAILVEEGARTVSTPLTETSNSELVDVLIMVVDLLTKIRYAKRVDPADLFYIHDPFDHTPFRFLTMVGVKIGFLTNGVNGIYSYDAQIAMEQQSRYIGSMIISHIINTFAPDHQVHAVQFICGVIKEKLAKWQKSIQSATPKDES